MPSFKFYVEQDESSPVITEIFTWVDHPDIVVYYVVTANKLPGEPTLINRDVLSGRGEISILFDFLTSPSPYPSIEFTDIPEGWTVVLKPIEHAVYVIFIKIPDSENQERWTNQLSS